MIWRREDREEPRREEARREDGKHYEGRHAESRRAEPEREDVDARHEDVQVRETRKGVRRMAEQGGEVTIIGAGAKLEGTVVSAGSLRVDGQVKGQISAEGDVMLAPQSQVDADIKAQNVSVAGRFKGSLQVRGRAELNRGGRVEGTITSKTLVIEEGGIFQGQSIMDQQAASKPQAEPARPPKAPQPAQEAKV
jgi:cytoskeletal protein CcmA (bactofilin family)